MFPIPPRVYATDALPYIDESSVTEAMLDNAKREIAIEMKRMPTGFSEYQRTLFPTDSSAPEHSPYQDAPLFARALASLAAKKSGRIRVDDDPSAVDDDDDAVAEAEAARVRRACFESDPTPASLVFPPVPVPSALESAALGAATQAARLRSLELMARHGAPAWVSALARTDAIKAAVGRELAASSSASEAVTEKRYRLQTAAGMRSEALMAEFGRLIDGNYQVRLEIERVNAALRVEKRKREEASAPAGTEAAK